MGETFWAQVQRGGPIVWALAALALVALALAVERFVALRGTGAGGIDAAAFLARVRHALLADGSVREAVKICEQRPGAVPAVVKAGLLKLGQPREDFESATAAAAQAEEARFGRGLWALAAIARVAPLAGLLGTVLALMDELGRSGTIAGVDGRALAGALFPAALGLGVAIPVEIAYNYLLGRVQRAMRDLQTARGSLRETLVEMERGGGDRRAPAGSGPR